MAVRGRAVPITVAAVLWTAAAVFYYVAEVVAAAGFPGYDYASDFISTLGEPGRSPHSSLMNAAFVCQGLLFPTGAVLVARGTRAPGTRWFLAFAVTNGVGNLIVAAVHSGTGSRWHVIGAVAAIGGGNAAVLAAGPLLGRAGASRAYVRASIVLGTVGLLCLLAVATGGGALSRASGRMGARQCAGDLCLAGGYRGLPSPPPRRPRLDLLRQWHVHVVDTGVQHRPVPQRRPHGTVQSVLEVHHAPPAHGMWKQVAEERGVFGEQPVQRQHGGGRHQFVEADLSGRYRSPLSM